jgi:AcrR family transcriptional regulator
MRIVKEADERKNEIIDVADELFSSKGYDNTTISEIIEKAGIARGTVYYHFKSKEDIMDALIERYCTELFVSAEKIARDRSIPVLERFFRTLMTLSKNDGPKITNNLHQPQNALMHEKIQNAMFQGIPPILTEIVKDGIEEKLFDTPYPYETIEMAVAHTNIVFDNYSANLAEGELLTKVKAFIYNLERLFGAKKGSFNMVLKLFEMESDSSDK